jgi:patatin-like phospholipase/acyl hydrolase
LKALREDFLAYIEQTEQAFIDTQRYIETHVAKTGAEIEKLTVQLMEAQEEGHKHDKVLLTQ